MALPPGFLKWDGAKYIFVPDFDQSFGPTIVNSGTGTLNDVTSIKDGLMAAVIIFSGASSMTVSGFASGIESREIKIFNTNSLATLTLTHLDSNSSSANQIVCPNGVSYSVGYHEAVLLTYSNTESKWRVVEKSISAGTPGGSNTQLQVNNNGVFGGITNWLSSGSNEVHIDYHIMQNTPALQFSGNQITRLFGTWTGDGFKVGDLFSIRGAWYDNLNNPQTPLNIINTTITNVTDTVLTMSAFISPAGYSLSGDIFAEGGGLLTGATSTVASSLPDSGIIRIPPLASQYQDIQVITTRDSSGDTVPIISVNKYTDLMIGGTYNESNTAAGVTNRRPSSISMWGATKIDFTDERIWRDDKGSYYDYLHEFRNHITTTDNTATVLLNQNAPSFQPYAFIELYVTAQKVSPVNEGATWRFFGSKASTSFDWRTANYHVSTAGATTWACVVTGDATITVTGQAGTNILWKVYAKFI